ncbi:MAG: cupin fold metalloprotein, WbuC family [Candidatus Eisenbacteria bacterium]|nr:cupin fold metalloprotein, WbuC family [Candidatus Eisenbacteria bacterium]
MSRRRARGRRAAGAAAVGSARRGGEGASMDRSARSRLPVEYITRALLRRLAAAARRAPRGRVNHNFHAYDDGYQRLLNVVQPGSYIRPHRHGHPPKSESFLVLRGEIGLFTFDERGGILEARHVGPHRETLGVDIAPGVWHCFAALHEDTVVFEGKNGPYDPATDKQFPDWAPADGEGKARDYLASLIDRLPRSAPRRTRESREAT